MKNENLIAVIDIGSSKIVAVLANISEHGDIDIIAFSEIASKGVKKGSIVNIALAQHMIDVVLDDLEANGSYHIHSLVSSLSGVNIMGHNSDGTVGVKREIISRQDIMHAISISRDTSLAEGRQLLHVIPQEFVVDNQQGIDDPIGLVGEKLEARVHIVSSAKTSYQNLHHAFSHRDIEIKKVISSNIASSTAVISKDEKELGVCVLDIGAGTTEMTLYANGEIRHSEIIPLGGELITSDIAFFMRSTIEVAENIKISIDINKMYTPGEVVEIPSIGDTTHRNFLKLDIANVIKERCEQLIEIVEQRLSRSGYEQMFPAGFVLCGGSANLKGIDKLFMSKTELPVRLAQVEVNYKEIPNNPKYATVVGLLIRASSEDYIRTVTDDTKVGIISSITSVILRLKRRLTDNF